MAAAWPAFILTLGAYLDIKLPKTEDDTAKKIASLFRTAVLTASADSVPGSFMVPVTPGPDEEDKIASGLLASFEIIKSENSISETSFTPFSESIIEFWLTSIWTKSAFPASFASAASVNVSYADNLNNLNSLLYEAFNTPPVPVAGGVIFSTRLSIAFTDHMKKIKIKYIGVTGNGSPITKTVTGVS